MMTGVLINNGKTEDASDASKIAGDKDGPWLPEGSKNLAHFIERYKGLFPKFPGHNTMVSEPLRWERYWDDVVGFQKKLQCGDMAVAYLLKSLALPGTDL